jgi:hypothetical protein
MRRAHCDSSDDVGVTAEKVDVICSFEIRSSNSTLLWHEQVRMLDFRLLWLRQSKGAKNPAFQPAPF